MKISRTLLSYAGTLGLVTLSQLALAQTPAPAAPAPAAPGAGPAAPAAPAPAAPGVGPAAPGDAPPPAAAEAPPPPPPMTGAVDLRPPPAVLPPPPPPLVEAAPVEPPAEMAEPLPKKLAVAKEGWLKFGGLAQAWYVFEQGENLRKDANMGKYVDNANYFRLRRGYFSVDGEVVPDTIKFKLLVDFAKLLKSKSTTITKADGSPDTVGYFNSDQDSSMLLDFALTYQTTYADVTVGQWKSLIGYEGFGVSSSELVIAERPYSTRYFGDNYDLGIKAEKKFEYIKYSAQVLQGGQSTTPDTNKQKELALRLEFYPIEGVYVGGAGVVSVGQRDTQDSTREAIEADAGYDKDGLLVRGEMLWQTKGPTDADERTDARGMSLTAAYTIAKKFQPAIRLGFLDVDETIDPEDMPLAKKFSLNTDEVRSYEVGLNYFIEGKNARVSATYGYYDFGYIDPRHMVILQGQVSY